MAVGRNRMPLFGPKSGRFYERFVAIGQIVDESSVLLVDALKQGLSERKETLKALQVLERAADSEVRELVTEAARSFVTPFDRDDMMWLARTLDEVVDQIEGSVDQMQLYGCELFPPDFTELGRILREAASNTAEALERLKQQKKLGAYLERVNQLERDGDYVYRRLQTLLFAGTYQPLDVMKFTNIADGIEEALDSLEDVIHLLEMILAESS